MTMNSPARMDHAGALSGIVISTVHAYASAFTLQLCLDLAAAMNNCAASHSRDLDIETKVIRT